MDIREIDIPTLPRGQKNTYRLDIAPKSTNKMWQMPLMTITGTNQGATLLVFAGVHGDEYEGIEAIPRIFAQIDPQQLSGTLLMVPVCNVPAYEAHMRNSSIDGLNLARVFPGDIQGTITEQIAYWLTEKFMKYADFFIDLHSGGIAANIPTLIGYIHSDSEVGQQSRAGAQIFGAPILWGHPLPIPPGRSISAATDLNIPSLYTEASGGGYAHPDNVACFVAGVLNVMKHLSMLKGVPNSYMRTHDLIGDGDLDAVILAPVEGYFRSEVELLDEVKRGDRLGFIQDMFGQLTAEIIADKDGVVIMLLRLHHVKSGDGLVHLTQHYRGE